MGANVWSAHRVVNVDSTVNMNAKSSPWISAAQAVELLGVNKATLYAYVSRGRIRSEATTGKSRARRYAREDVERLRVRAEERRHPEKAAENALNWGLPTLESSITLISNDRLYYRGQDATDLARSSSVVEVASLIWAVPEAGESGPATMAEAALGKVVRSNAPFVSRAQMALAREAGNHSLGYDLRPRAVARTGWRILRMLTAVAANGHSGGSTIDSTLALAWGVPSAEGLLRSALILCADHELNASTFTARCVASAGGSPYGAVLAGLAALEGVKHGGTTARIESMWDSVHRSRRLRSALAERVRRGERIEGFGHPLYRSGDPRAKLLLEMLPRSRRAQFARMLSDEIQDLLGESPNVDFALVALARTLRLPAESALILFALGRTIGWIGHILEQYAVDAIIRPRAKYIGPRPD
jgi:citrate synthase